MKPPFQITSNILNLVASISMLLGKFDSVPMVAPEPRLRKKNQIRTIKSTLAIEGNTFTEEQISAILENKKVLGPKKEIIEVQNAIKIYNEIEAFSYFTLKHFLKAHQILMNDLVDSAGKFRTKNVGVLKGTVVKHLAPKPAMVAELMSKLFSWAKEEIELHFLIKSCIVHYEIEFIHPFEDGNGRMGRLWQTLILAKHNSVFKFVPVESLIEKNQMAYYEALEKCDKAGESTDFIEFMLGLIHQALKEFDSETVSITPTLSDRMTKAKTHFGKKAFSRKDYMELFKSISSATASRELRAAVDEGRLLTEGNKNQTRYYFK